MKKSRKGQGNIDAGILLSIFVFLGSFVFLAGLYYSSLPESVANVSGLQKPPEINTSEPITSYMGMTGFIDYAQTTIYNISATNPAFYLILLVPITIVISFILVRLAKPFS